MSIETKPQTPDALTGLKKKAERMAMTGRGSMTAEAVLAIDNADWIAAEHIRRVAERAQRIRAEEDRAAMHADTIVGDILETFPGSQIREGASA